MKCRILAALVAVVALAIARPAPVAADPPVASLTFAVSGNGNSGWLSVPNDNSCDATFNSTSTGSGGTITLKGASDTVPTPQTIGTAAGAAGNGYGFSIAPEGLTQVELIMTGSPSGTYSGTLTCSGALIPASGGGGGATNATIVSPLDGSGYVEVDVKAGSLTTTFPYSLATNGQTATTASGLGALGVYNSTAPTLTNGQAAPLQENANGALEVALPSPTAFAYVEPFPGTSPFPVNNTDANGNTIVVGPGAAGTPTGAPVNAELVPAAGLNPAFTLSTVCATPTTPSGCASTAQQSFAVGAYGVSGFSVQVAIGAGNTDNWYVSNDGVTYVPLFMHQQNAGSAAGTAVGTATSGMWVGNTATFKFLAFVQTAGTSTSTLTPYFTQANGQTFGVQPYDSTGHPEVTLCGYGANNNCAGFTNINGFYLDTIATQNSTGTQGTILPTLGDTTATVNVSTATTTQLVALVTSKYIFVTGYSLYVQAGTLPSFQFEYGTGTNCGTGTTVIGGTFGAIAGAVGELFNSPASGPSAVFTVPAGDALCLVSGGTTPTIQGFVTYAQHT